MSRILGNQKFCPHCKNYKSPADFGTDRSRKDSLHPHCKMCRRGYKLLDLPVPKYMWHVNTMRPRRLHIPERKWELFDALVDAGVQVDIILPDLSKVGWGGLE